MAKLNLLKKYSIQCGVAFALAIITWLLLMYAEAYAWYLRDINNYIESSPLNYFSNDISRLRVYYLMFFIPFSVVIISRKVVWLRHVWLFIAFILTVSAALTIGSGGDRKGCEACLGVAYLHLLVLPVPAILSVFYVIYRWLRPTKEENQTC